MSLREKSKEKMNQHSAEISDSDLDSVIFVIRGIPVVLQSDLELLYGIDSDDFDERVEENIALFPATYRFQLMRPEFEKVWAKLIAFSSKPHPKINDPNIRILLPYVFSAPGIAMLTGVFRSDIVIQTSIRLIKAMDHHISEHHSFVV